MAIMWRRYIDYSVHVSSLLHKSEPHMCEVYFYLRERERGNIHDTWHIFSYYVTTGIDFLRKVMYSRHFTCTILLYFQFTIEKIVQNAIFSREFLLQLTNP